MKHYFLFLLLLTTICKLNAAPVLRLQLNNGDWKTGLSWDLLRAPVDGDTIVVPAGMTAFINDNMYSTAQPTLYIKIFGTLHFNGGGAKLNLSENSVVMVYQGGKITSTSSPSQIIAVGGVTKYEGNGGTIVGPVVADKNSGAGFAFAGAGVLPVKFLGFSLSRQEQSVLVQWSVSGEINIDYYSIERSLDGTNWNTITTIKAKSFTTYSYNDKVGNNSSLLYYRIRQVENTGDYAFSGIRSVYMNWNSNDVTAFVSGNTILVHFPQQIKEQVSLQVISVNGSIISSQVLNQPAGQVLVPVHTKGHYILNITGSRQLKVSKQIIL